MPLPTVRTRALSLLLTLALPLAAMADGQNFTNTLPSPQQVAWQDLQFGVIVHFGTNTFLDREWGDGTAPASVFNPDHVDPGQWARAVRAAGARYMVLVAKHHDGFSLWPTEQSDYSVKSSPWLHGKGDLVKLTSEAARKEGLGFGVYLSPWDRHEPKYADKAAYDKYYAAQLDELATGYGPLVEWWLDGAGSAGHVYDFDHYIEELRTYQPNTMVFADVALFSYGDIRWAGNEHGATEGETWNVIDRHGELRWRPVEVDTPLHKDHWFFSSKPDFAASLNLVGQHQRHLQVSQRAVAVVVGGAELAHVEQRDVIELRQQPRVELVDVAEVGLVGVAKPRVLDQQLYVVVVFLRRGGDAEHGVVVLGRLEADDVVIARAEVEDGGAFRLPLL